MCCIDYMISFVQNKFQDYFDNLSGDQFINRLDGILT